MITSDISGLFTAAPNGPAPATGFRQARLVEYDPNTGFNTVVIPGAPALKNLPLLVSGAELSLQPGDNVILMYLNSTVLIVGKVATPGGPNFGASQAQGRLRVALAATPVPSLPSGTPVNAITGAVGSAPTWAHSAYFDLDGWIGMQNTSSNVTNISAQIIVTGSISGTILGTGSGNQAVSGTWNFMAERAMKWLLPIQPGEELTCSFQVESTDTTIPSGGLGYLNGLINFYRETA